MATGGGARLLRGRTGPQRATFLELFFDLAYIFVFTRLSQALGGDLSWAGAGRVLVLLLPLWWVWTRTTWISDALDPDRPAIQVPILAAMLSVLVMAAAVPYAYGSHKAVFAGTYVALQLGGSLYLVLVMRGHHLRQRYRRTGLWYVMSACPWLAGALIQGGVGEVLWTVGAGVDYTGGLLRWPAPKLGRVTSAEWQLSGEHLSERYRQLLVIALGEPIILASTIYSNGRLDMADSAGFVTAFLTAVLLGRIYIYHAGKLLEVAIAEAPEPAEPALMGALIHLVMIAGVVVVAVGNQIIVTHPLGATRMAWRAVLIGGPALFLTGRALLDYAVFGQVSRVWFIGLLALGALTPLSLVSPPLPISAAVAVVLCAIVVINWLSQRGHPDVPPRPPHSWLRRRHRHHGARDHPG